MATMRAVQIANSAGPASALHISPDVPRPVPTASEALVRVRAFGLNRMDLLQREGKYPVPAGASRILGVEFSGVIEEIGGERAENEEGWEVGDEVFGLAYGGAYAEYIAVSRQMLVHKPPSLSFEQCAGLPEVWITALQAMYLVGSFFPGKSILWHAGGSSVSIAGVQLSLADSASHVYTTTRSDAKSHFSVHTLGATASFNAKTTDWAAEILRLTEGRGVDVVVDFVGADYFQGNLDVCALDGTVVVLGTMSGTGLEGKNVDMGPILRKRLKVQGSTLRSRDEGYQGRLRDEFVRHALPKLVDGTFSIHVDRVFDFDKIVEAHEVMERNETQGKLIVRIS